MFLRDTRVKRCVACVTVLRIRIVGFPVVMTKVRLRERDEHPDECGDCTGIEVGADRVEHFPPVEPARRPRAGQQIKQHRQREPYVANELAVRIVGQVISRSGWTWSSEVYHG